MEISWKMRVAGVAEYCGTVKNLPRYEGGSERGAAWGVLFPFWELFFDTCAQKWFAIHAEHDKISAKEVGYDDPCH